jgi:plastocyanin
MQNKTIWVGVGIIFAVLIAGVFLLGRVGKQSSETLPSEVPLTPTPSPQTSDKTTPVEGEVQEITLEATEFSYSKETITVKKGQKVRLTLVNKGRMSHDFVVEKMNVTTELAGSGKSVTTEFTINDAGSYAFYCSVGNHRAMGMEGVLIVE